MELFAGLGCVARAFEETGKFEAAILVDSDASAVAACRDNGIGSTQVQADVRQLDGALIHKHLDGRKLAGVLGCPPCQGFSSAGQRKADDNRNDLLGHFFRLVTELEPDFFVMENVPAVLRSKLLYDALAMASEYSIWKGVLNAALYGTPQTRQRAVVIGYRRALGLEPSPPPPSHLGSVPVYDYQQRALSLPALSNGVGTLGLYAELGRPERLGSDAARLLVAPDSAERPLVTVGEAIADLPPPSGYVAVAQQPSSYARELAEVIHGSDCNHLFVVLADGDDHFMAISLESLNSDAYQP